MCFPWLSKINLTRSEKGGEISAMAVMAFLGSMVGLDGSGAAHAGGHTYTLSWRCQAVVEVAELSSL